MYKKSAEPNLASSMSLTNLRNKLTELRAPNPPLYRPNQIQNIRLQLKYDTVKYSPRNDFYLQYLVSPTHNNNSINSPSGSQNKIASPRYNNHQNHHLNDLYQSTARSACLDITLHTPNAVHAIKFKYNPNTTVRELDQHLKEVVDMPFVLFKSGNMMVDYFLTQQSQKVSQLKNMSLILRATEIVRTPCPDNSLKRFNIIKCVGSGGFAKVFFAEVNGMYVALKVINKNFLVQNEKEMIVENERNILIQLENHPFVTKVHYTLETQNFICLALEYCSGGQLFYLLKKVKRMKEDEARFYFVEVLMALKALHQKNIVYRDLKPENIIIDSQGHVRLADFGLSKYMQSDLTHSFCGSAEYMAPEMLSKTGHNASVDHYCIGALLYELVTGLPPYYCKDQSELFRNILTSNLEFPDRLNLSPQIKSLLTQLLHKNPKRRLGYSMGIIQIMAHPWLKGISMTDVMEKKLIPPFKPNLLEYNFDDSEYKQEESESLVELLKQKELGDLKLPLFRKFFFESDQMKRRKLEISGVYHKKDSASTGHLSKNDLGYVRTQISAQSPRLASSPRVLSPRAAAPVSSGHIDTVRPLSNNSKNIELFPERKYFPSSKESGVYSRPQSRPQSRPESRIPVPNTRRANGVIRYQPPPSAQRLSIENSIKNSANNSQQNLLGYGLRKCESTQNMSYRYSVDKKKPTEEYLRRNFSRQNILMQANNSHMLENRNFKRYVNQNQSNGTLNFNVHNTSKQSNNSVNKARPDSYKRLVSGDWKKYESPPHVNYEYLKPVAKPSQNLKKGYLNKEKIKNYFQK